jgi:DNA-directed RNA polymerase subunit omega
MARLTVENIKIDNRYEMILLAAHRARNLEFGAQPLIEVKNKKVKHALLALMEIEAGEIDIEELRKTVANQGESTIKTTEVVKENERQQEQSLDSEKDSKSEISADAKDIAVEQMIYKDEEIED